MSIFDVLQLAGGLALFLYGMTLMEQGLNKLSGGRMEEILSRLTSNVFKGVLLGAGVTAVFQSSSATTVMVVGFVNAGIMSLNQAVGVIMGANIGTTATSWILSLTGIQGSSIFVRMLNPDSFSPILAMVGVIMIMLCKSDRRISTADILLGFSILMFGMSTMSSAVAPLKNVPEFTHILVMFQNPLLGVLAGAVLTAVIQSSSASVGILQALCVTGTMSYSTVLPVIMGQNIGTCVTAMISAIGASKNAKRTAFIHLYFNLIATVVFLFVFYILNSFIHFRFMVWTATPAGIAVVHTCFNVLATLFWLPLHRMLVYLATVTVRDSETSESTDGEDADDTALKRLDRRFLSNPGFAVKQADLTVQHMGHMVAEELAAATSLILNFDREVFAKAEAGEEKIDIFEDRLNTYLTQISENDESKTTSRKITELQHCVGDFERISDHSLNLAQSARKMHDKDRHLSDKAVAELTVYINAVTEILKRTLSSFEKNDKIAAKSVEPLEDVIDRLDSQVKKRQTKRLKKGKCSVENGFILSDISTDLERIADHCSNIAISVLQEDSDENEAHEYLETLDRSSDREYTEQYLRDKEQFALP